MRVDPNQGNYYRVRYDAQAYCPWFSDEAFMSYSSAIEGFTAVPPECRWTIYLMARQCLHVEGDFYECGVDRGGSAKLIASVMRGSGKRLHLFDTFAGMPAVDESIDGHRQGDFPHSSPDVVREFVGYHDEVILHAGVIPDTFAGAEGPISFAHVDVDLYESTKACCEFIYPRLSRGGVMVLDDYARPSCRGARLAIDEYFADKPSVPLTSVTSAQAVVFKP